MDKWNGSLERWRKRTGQDNSFGHWNCSYRHSVLEHKGSQYNEDADHSPFYGDGIIAIDACTPLSKKINCLVLRESDCDCKSIEKSSI